MILARDMNAAKRAADKRIKKSEAPKPLTRPNVNIVLYAAGDLSAAALDVPQRKLDRRESQLYRGVREQRRGRRKEVV